jgi:glutaconate CoA-transferase subunit A
MTRTGPALLAARVTDGASVALAPDYSGCSLALVRELVRRRARDLLLVGVPQLGLQADILIGAGCVRGIETAAISLGEQGPAPAFQRLWSEGRIDVRDSTCPAIHAGLQAAEKGLPFMPVRGILGTDLLASRPDWIVTKNPFPPHDEIVLVPAIRPDLALFHAPRGDDDGNVWIGVRRELMVMAHAARCSLVTVEGLDESSLLRDPALAAGTIPRLYVDGIAEAPKGAAPLGLFGCYPPDEAGIARYADLARTAAGFSSFVDAWLADG